MSPKKGRKNVRNIEVPTDTPAAFELRETDAYIKRREEEAEKEQKEERAREEARWAEPHNNTQRKQRQKRHQELTGVTVKWTQRVTKRWVHLNYNPGARKDI